MLLSHSPGGFGTIEELFEILTLKQLQYHTKPITLVNTNGFYEHLIRFFEHIYLEKFAKPVYRQLYDVAPDPASAFSYVDTYQPIQLQNKWF